MFFTFRMGPMVETASEGIAGLYGGVPLLFTQHSKDDLQKQVYMEMTTDGLPEGGDSQAVRDSKTWVDKLTEEIVTDNDTGYIYESPDGGKTVYKRKEGSDKRELVKDWEKIKNNE